MSSATYGRGRCAQCWGQVLVAAMNSQSPFSMISQESAYEVFLWSLRYFSMLPGICCVATMEKNEEYRKRDPRSWFVSVENSG